MASWKAMEVIPFQQIPIPTPAGKMMALACITTAIAITIQNWKSL